MDKTAITTKLEKLEGESVKVIVTVSSSDVDKSIAKAYKDAASKYRIPGFRPGRAPRPVIDNAIGREAVLATATDMLLNETYPIAIDSNDIYPLEDPQFKADELVVAGSDYSYEVTVVAKPELELSHYEPVEIELPAPEATDEEVDAQLDVLKSYQYDFEEVAGRTVQEEDYLLIGVDAEKDGEKIERLCNEERIYQLGQGLFPKAFDDKLIGLNPGENVKFTLTEEDDMKDAPIDFDVKIVKIREKVYKDIDDEFAQKCGADSLADLKERITESITAQKTSSLPRWKETECSYAIAERLQGEVPERMVTNTRGELAQQLFQSLQQNGMTFDMYLMQAGLTAEQFQEDLNKQAKDVAAQGLALDAIARHFEFTVSEEEIEKEFLLATDNDKKEAKKLRQEWEESGRMSQLREALLRSQASHWLIENAVATEPVAEDAPAKKAPAKKATKKAAAKQDAATEESAPKKEAAAKKPAAKKTAKKADDAQAKPAAKKASAKSAPEKDEK